MIRNLLRPFLAPQAYNPAAIRVARRMSSTSDVESICRTISQSYSACDVSDALLKLKVPQAGFLADITPIPNYPLSSPKPVVAPLSTVLFAPKSPTATQVSKTPLPAESNIAKGAHWTDLPAPGTIAILQQPTGQICAVCGDILATRLKVRGVKGLIADGRVRDLASMRELVRSGDGGGDDDAFTVWSRGSSTVGTGLEAKPWSIDVSLHIGGVTVQPGDILCADAEDGGCVVIPRDQLEELMKILPGLKEADDKCVADVQAGVDVNETFRRHRG